MGETRDITSLAGSGLPPRVRAIAAQLLHASKAALGSRIQSMLEQLETALFKQAERARSPAEQSELLKAVQALKQGSAAFAPAYFKALEGELAQLRGARVQARAGGDGEAALPSSQWTVNADAPDTDIAQVQLRDIATPLEASASLPLYLLGQRFGVLAGAPAFSPAQICLAPRTLIALAGQVALREFDERVPASTLQSQFAQQVLGDYPAFVERINATLDEAGVLPGLSHVPVRPVKASKAVTATAAPAQTDAPPAATTHTRQAGPATRPGPSWGRDDAAAWFEQPMHAPLVPPAPPMDFRALQQLLTAHRIAGKLPPREAPPPGAEIDSTEVGRLLQALQAAQPSGVQQARSIHGLREHLLQHARAEHGPMANLTREDSDTFEILSILYAEVAREVRAGSSVHGLLERLQLPVLRLALKDRSFFDQTTHPARQLLNTIAESDASLYGDHAIDPYFEAAMRKAVALIEDDIEAKPALLAEVNDELQAQFRQQVKRSLTSEKRVVEAARGRDRMAVAKQTASAALQSLLETHAPPRAIEVLMRRAWLDAMTLTMLRNGEASPAWQQQLDITRQILQTVTSKEPLQSAALAADIVAAMRRVGYHEKEAGAISRHLSRSHAMPRDADEPSATELSARIKAHARLGDADAGDWDDKAERLKLAPRTPAEEECYRHLRTLPFGCWVDFIRNQQGQAERRRLSWYSTITDRALFVNRRGQRVADIHMDTLARLMAQGQLRVVAPGQLRLIDRALRSTVELLRGTFGSGPPAWKAPE